MTGLHLACAMGSILLYALALLALAWTLWTNRDAIMDALVQPFPGEEQADD